MLQTKKDAKKIDGMSFMQNTSGDTYCYMTFKGQDFTGHTKCLPEDEDFWSERVGCQIAEWRATIKKMKWMKAQLVPELNALKNFEKTLKCCKNYNPQSFEARRLRKEIWIQQQKINEIAAAIKDTEDYMYQYIQGKDKLYKRLRSKDTK